MSQNRYHYRIKQVGKITGSTHITGGPFDSYDEALAVCNKLNRSHEHGRFAPYYVSGPKPEDVGAAHVSR